MAKVTGPLMSLDASGSVAGTVVFSKWKGRNYVRLLVTPQNPQSTSQQLTRGYLGVLAKAAAAVLTFFKDSLHVGSQFFLDAVAQAPTGQSWISYFQAWAHGLVDSLHTEYLALSSTIRGYYDTGADSLGILAYTTVGSVPVTYTKGFQVFLLAKFAFTTLSYTGFATTPDAASSTEITNFVSYVQDSV